MAIKQIEIGQFYSKHHKSRCWVCKLSSGCPAEVAWELNSSELRLKVRP